MSGLLRFAPVVVILLAHSERTVHTAELKKDITFVTRGKQELKLDIALPDEGRMRPAVLCIHGGGWRSGNRQVYLREIQRLARRGYVAATIDYRLTDVAVWPAQIDDVKAALQWLVDHAEEYGVDRERIGVMGASAGGHLSLMLGVLPNEGGNDLRLRAIANYFGPTDMRNVEKMETVRQFIEPLIDGKLEDHPKKLTAISPAVLVDRTDPAVITLHGTEDPLVSFEHAEVLHAALRKANVPNTLFPMKGAGHGISGKDAVPAVRAYVKFLDDYLKGTDLPLVVSEDFEKNADRWEPTDASAWSHSMEGRSRYQLTKKRSDYEPKHRSPFNISLLKDVEVGDFVLDVDLRSTHEVYGHQDLCLFFGHQDPEHFYYVHIGRKADAHANSIFLVNDAPRVSICEDRTEGTDWSTGWHRARIRRNTKAGTIEVFFDDMQKPIMKTTDKTFLHGRIGIGSFDDTGEFDAIRLWGHKLGKAE